MRPIRRHVSEYASFAAVTLRGDDARWRSVSRSSAQRPRSLGVKSALVSSTRSMGSGFAVDIAACHGQGCWGVTPTCDSRTRPPKRTSHFAALSFPPATASYRYVRPDTGDTLAAIGANRWRSRQMTSPKSVLMSSDSAACTSSGEVIRPDTLIAFPERVSVIVERRRYGHCPKGGERRERDEAASETPVCRLP